MKKYVDMYVLCNICKNSHTEMHRNIEIKNIVLNVIIVILLILYNYS